MRIVRQQAPRGRSGVSHVVPNETYAMIADVLAGKIMTELSVDRPNAARETAIELFNLLDQGVSVKSINANYLANQIMDIYLTGQSDMGNVARGYFEQLCKRGLDMGPVNTDMLRKGSLQVAEHVKDAKTIASARDFARSVTACTFM